MNKNKAYVVYKRKIPLAVLIRFEDKAGVVRESRNVDMSLFGIWKGRGNGEIMREIKKKSWKTLEGDHVD